ncbi:MAG TPA: hypothetical protein VGL53_01525, partial [Bryobacteraceae bacterium]
TPLADFETRIAAYMKIHKAAASQKGALSPTKSPEQIDAKSTALAEGIRKLRANAKQGDIFTTPIAAEFRKIIAADVKRRPRRIYESIRSGAVVSANVQVNGPYPEEVPLETMPPTLLASLPKLPPELLYRFVGSTLVLHDVTANLIVDLMPNAIVFK